MFLFTLFSDMSAHIFIDEIIDIQKIRLHTHTKRQSRKLHKAHTNTSKRLNFTKQNRRRSDVNPFLDRTHTYIENKTLCIQTQYKIYSK